MRAVSDNRHEAFAHGIAYVMCSRTTGFDSLAFLHAPLAAGCAGPPTFENIVLQRALAAGVLNGAGRPPAQARGAMEVGEGGEGSGSDSGDSSSGEDGGGEGAQAPRPKRQRRAPAQGPLPAAFQTGAMTLTERRGDTHARVQHVYARPPRDEI